jgi:hypothetical protein
MVYVPPKEERKQKYTASIAGVPAAYGAGIQRTSDWKGKALAGQGLYEEQMRNQEVLSRRARGLEKVSETDWKNKATSLGVTRIAAGMQAGAQKQADNYEATAEALRAVELPARVADPVQNIQNRVVPIVLAAVNSKKR